MPRMLLSPLLIIYSLLFANEKTVHVDALALSLPEKELVNRRKSPALWRVDLSHGRSKQNKKNENTPIKLDRKVELMVPVGGWPQLYAAVSNGADAIYLGLESFSARARASNFNVHTELPKAVELCHKANVKVYVALNTLVFPNELDEVESILRAVERAKVDAVIVQDLGICRLIKEVTPTLEVHASTQQSITNTDGVFFSGTHTGATRAVLGRELSLVEIESVVKNLNQKNQPVEVEAFVHGALCVSYSGQCFSSEFVGGRSANRGQCAQACRLPYGLIDNGELKELGDFSYLLSPQDLCGIDHVPALLRAGVACLKIEGRLKDAAYVAATTRAYRNAVDQAWKEYLEETGHDTDDNKLDNRQLSLPDESVSKAELAQMFSRGQDEDHDGLSSGFFDGPRHQHLVRGRSPRHRGVHIGRVMEGSSWKNGLMVALDDDDNDTTKLKRGDGLVIDRGLAQEEELGGPIFDVHINQQQGKRVASIQFSKAVQKKWKRLDDQAKRLGPDAKSHAPVGAHVWKTSDASVEKKMKRLSEAPLPKANKVAQVTVEGSIGSPLVVTITDITTGLQGVGMSEGTLQPAEKKGLDSKAIQKAIGALGDTEWALASKDAIDTSNVEASAWCPASWIKQTRRQAVEDLQSFFNNLPASIDDGSEGNEVDAPPCVTSDLIASYARKHSNGEASSETKATAKISVLARNYEQVDAICNMIERGEASEVDEVMIDFLEVDGMRDAVERIRKAGTVKVVVASPRIIKPGESGIWRTLLRLQPDGLLVRSTGLLHRMMKLGGQGAKVEITVHQVGEEGTDSNSMEQTMAVQIPELIGDFSLNVANPLTAWELLSLGCSRVTASYDLNANGITELLESMGNIQHGASRVEIIAHTHIPIFHTEHCVFARFLSKGNSYLDCGHACTRHNIHLRDQTGADNLVLADMGCRNTVFASEAQSGVHTLKEWTAAGAARYRIELVDEGPEDVGLVIQGYQSVITGQSRASELWELLKTVCDSNGRCGGVGHGSLRNSPVRRAGEIS